MKITESNFIAQLKKKNEKALEYVIQEYGWVIQTVMKKKMGSLPDYQEECWNDVLIAVWEHSNSFNPNINTFQNWLAGVTRFKALDYIRKYVSRSREEAAEYVPEQEDEKAQREFLRQEMKEEVEEILSWLSEEDGKLFRKLYLEEKSVDMVAVETGLNKAVIYSRISRGKKKIRMRLSSGKGQ